MVDWKKRVVTVSIVIPTLLLLVRYKMGAILIVHGILVKNNKKYIKYSVLWHNLNF